jgi:hypothetical protein
MTKRLTHRLNGLEPDNLLAFLALLGLLRSLERDDRKRAEHEKIHPGAKWDIDCLPVRPVLVLAQELSVEEVLMRVSNGIEALAAANEFNARKDLNYTRGECRELLVNEARSATRESREHVDVLASLMSDSAIKDGKEKVVDPTPLCLLFGQGHQHFLERLADVPRTIAPPPRGRGRQATPVSAIECLGEALFESWRRADPTPSFRWDPEEDIRYALMAGDPTDSAYKGGTQHGANRLGAIGLGVLTLVPETRAGRVRPSIIGGASERGFSFAWPIWRERATLAAIRALLGHPKLREPGALAHLAVVDVVVARRISVGKFMNFTRARQFVARPGENANEQSGPI